MPRYRLVFAGSAKKDNEKLDKLTWQRIAKKLQYFLEQDNPLAYARQLVHSSIGSYHFRVGHFRIVFDIDGTDLAVVNVKHRKDI